MKDIDYDKTLICTKKYNSNVDAYVYSIRIETRTISEENVPEEYVAHFLAERMRAYINSHEFVDIEEQRSWTFDIEQAMAAKVVKQ